MDANLNASEVTRAMNRIRKMLALSRDEAATEGERDNALRMAHATMVKYNLDMMEVDASAQPDDPRGQHQDAYLGKMWCRQISMLIADLMFCKYYYNAGISKGGPNEKVIHAFIGKRSNATMAMELARYVVESTNKEAGRAQRAVGGDFAYHRAFCLGVVNKLQERCRALKAQAALPPGEVAAPGTALVVASLYRREAEENAKLMAGIALGKGRSGKGTSNHEAYNQGKAYGGTISLTHRSGNHKRIK